MIEHYESQQRDNMILVPLVRRKVSFNIYKRCELFKETMCYLFVHIKRVVMLKKHCKILFPCVLKDTKAIKCLRYFIYHVLSYNKVCLA